MTGKGFVGRFNSASTLSSRRTVLLAVGDPGGDQLQFGLDAVVEENISQSMALAA